MNKGERAEQVANWYFRLNGFLSIPGFIVHPDIQRPYPRTEADLIAVRFPYSKEKIASRDAVILSSMYALIFYVFHILIV